MAGLWRSNRDLWESCKSPFWALGWRFWSVYKDQKIDCCLVWQNQLSDLHQSDNGGTLQPEELTCGKLPPTQNALLKHVGWAAYQAGIWTASTQEQRLVPPPHELGWTKESKSWFPVWISIPEVSRACSQRIKCSCKEDCVSCKCGKANFVCSLVCNSTG